MQGPGQAMGWTGEINKWLLWSSTVSASQLTSPEPKASVSQFSGEVRAVHSLNPHGLPLGHVTYQHRLSSPIKCHKIPGSQDRCGVSCSQQCPLQAVPCRCHNITMQTRQCLLL